MNRSGASQLLCSPVEDLGFTPTLHTLTNTWALFIRWRGETPQIMGCFLLPLASPWQPWATAFVVCRSEAGDPAALRFSMTHNINHFIEVGQILLEILLKCGGTAQAGGRHCAWERLTRPPPAAGSVSQQQQLALWLKTATESRQDQRARTSLLSELRLTSGNIRWRESTVSLSCTLITDCELTLAC